MIIFYDITKEIIKEHKPNLPHFPKHPCRILLIVGSLSEKTNSFF